MAVHKLANNLVTFESSPYGTMANRVRNVIVLLYTINYVSVYDVRLSRLKKHNSILKNVLKFKIKKNNDDFLM